MRRLLVPTDVPIHRPSVGAMALAAGSQAEYKPFKPYVYRGTGEDQYDTVVIEEPKPKKRKRKAKKYRPRIWRVLHDRPELPDPPYAPPTYEPIRPKPKPIRPAPGWRPTSGDDIDAMLKELDE